MCCGFYSYHSKDEKIMVFQKNIIKSLQNEKNLLHFT